MAGYTIRNQQGLHYLTFTVVGWVDVFTRKQYRDVILDSFRYCQKERGLLVYGYVIMSISSALNRSDGKGGII